MALVFGDRIKETTTTSGSTDFTLLGAVTGYRAFSSVLSTSDTCYYCCVSAAGGWEVGLGTFTSPSTLARTTVLSSSNSGSKTVFDTDTKEIFLTCPASECGPNAKYPDSANGKTYRVSFTNGAIVAVEV